MAGCFLMPHVCAGFAVPAGAAAEALPERKPGGFQRDSGRDREAARAGGVQRRQQQPRDDPRGRCQVRAEPRLSIVHCAGEMRLRCTGWEYPWLGFPVEGS